MRPDTPQKYEFITLENINGQSNILVDIFSWKQFFDLKGQKETLLSTCDNITLKNIDFKCKIFLNIEKNTDIHLSNFLFENLNIEAKNSYIERSLIQELTLKNVKINKILIE